MKIEHFVTSFWNLA